LGGTTGEGRHRLRAAVRADHARDRCAGRRRRPGNRRGGPMGGRDTSAVLPPRAFPLWHLCRLASTPFRPDLTELRDVA
jgi:hypothetical protein